MLDSFFQLANNRIDAVVTFLPIQSAALIFQSHPFQSHSASLYPFQPLGMDGKVRPSPTVESINNLWPSPTAIIGGPLPSAAIHNQPTKQPKRIEFTPSSSFSLPLCPHHCPKTPKFDIFQS
jgi:hypothetical protein